MFKVNIKINGKNVPSYFHEGDNYIEGRKGSEYTIEFVNNSNNRILIIPSVDGLSVFDGKPATENSRGYIINANSSINIPGWTLDSEKVAKFIFGNVDNSYSTYQTGNTDNNGVIGFKVFSEARKIYTMDLTNEIGSSKIYGDYFKNIPPNDYWLNTSDISNQLYGNAFSTMNASVQNMTQEIGTGFGKETDFKTHTEEFSKGNLLDTILIYYDSLKGLKDRGVKIEPIKHKPKAFVEYGCVPPKNWNNR